MAYCSHCAAVLETGKSACARCGREVLDAALAQITFSAPPTSVRTAVGLLLISWIIPLLLLIRDSITYGGHIGIMAQTAVFSLLWIVFILFLWQRQGWARIAIVALVVFAVGNIALSTLRIGSALLGWRWALALGEDFLRICAVYFLFRPESNAWFKK
jgi:hypothetical protein